MNNQRTLSYKIKAKGIGLHTGHESVITLRPAPEDTGVVFRRIDIDPVVEFRISPFIVGNTTLCTTIVKDGVKIATIEHIMSALAGVGIDNIYIDITSDEVPIMDGSSSHFVFLLQSAGITSQNKLRKFIRIKKKISVRNDKAGTAEFKPYKGFKLNFSIDFNHPVFNETAKKMSLDFSCTSYFKEVARARTFGFIKDIEKLRKKQLAIGANLNNAIGLDDNGVMNKEGLRHQDEFVRHKILDAVGDLYMVGYPIVGEFTAHKSGHALNNQLLRNLMADKDAYEIIYYKDKLPINYESSKILG